MSSTNAQNPPTLPAFMTASSPYVFLAILVFAAYGNIFDNEFLFDDDLIIRMNSFLKDWNHIGDILIGSTTSGVQILGGFYRPLQILLYLFAYRLGDGSMFWFHILNLTLHIANTGLVYKLGTKLGFNPKGVFLAALVWGLHPIHTEAVTYMSGTADPLFVFFALWATIVLLPDFSPRKILFVIPLILLGIVSKETMVMFPLLAMVSLFYLNPKRFAPKPYVRTWPLWVLSLVYAYWRTHAEGFDGPQTYERFYAMPSFSALKIYADEPLYRLYTCLATLPEYLRLLVWPTHLHMERAFAVHSEFLTAPVLSGVAMAILVTAFLIYSFRTNRWTAMGWGFLWFMAAHAPDTGLLVPMNALFLEHWMYLPSVGLFLGLGQTLTDATKNRPAALRMSLAGLAAIFALTMAVKTYYQNKIWRDPALFYTNIFENGEESARAHNNLALYYAGKNQQEPAIEHFNRAIQISDAYAETHYNLAIAYLKKGPTDENIAMAVRQLERSIEIQPNFYRSYTLLSDISRNALKDKEKADAYRAKAKAYEPKQR